MIEGLILGLIQGIAEWLPVSSEGVMSLVMVNFFGYELVDAVMYAIFLHFGTLLASSVYFRKDLFNAFKDVRYKKDSMFWFVGIATFCSLAIGGPIVLFGLDKIDARYANLVIGGMLLVTAFLLRFSSKKKNKVVKKLNMFDSWIIGLVQGFAALPGISRSGSTVSALLLRKYNQEDALKISFIMSIPLVLVSTVYLAFSEAIVFTLDSVVALFVAFVVGYLTISGLMKVAKKINFWIFCLVMGILVILSMFV